MLPAKGHTAGKWWNWQMIEGLEPELITTVLWKEYSDMTDQEKIKVQNTKWIRQFQKKKVNKLNNFDEMHGFLK